MSNDSMNGPQVGQDNYGKTSLFTDADADDYLADLAALDMTEAQKRELLRVLFDIMRHFVEIGFDVGQADVCGQIFGEFNLASAAAPDDVESSIMNAVDEAVAGSEKEETDDE